MAKKAPISRSMILENSPSVIMATCEQVVSELKANGFDEDSIFGVHLSLNEALINALNHGNKNDPAREIELDYLITADRIEISVADQGKGFDPDAVPDPRREENLYKGVGRGLLLIRSYMNVVEFNDRGNRVRMVRHKGKQPQMLA